MQIQLYKHFQTDGDYDIHTESINCDFNSLLQECIYHTAVFVLIFDG